MKNVPDFYRLYIIKLSVKGQRKRKCKVVEKAPSDILMKVTDIVTAEIEII
jgi:hypothetical protein